MALVIRLALPGYIRHVDQFAGRIQRVGKCPHPVSHNEKAAWRPRGGRGVAGCGFDTDNGGGALGWRFFLFPFPALLLRGHRNLINPPPRGGPARIAFLSAGRGETCPWPGQTRPRPVFEKKQSHNPQSINHHSQINNIKIPSTNDSHQSQTHIN